MISERATVSSSLGFLDQVVLTEDEERSRRLRFPIGASATMETLEAPDCLDFLARIRPEEPVSWLPALNGWLITSRALAREALTSPALTVQSNDNLVRKVLGPAMLTVDGDDHRRLRDPFAPDFRVRVVEDRYYEACEAVAAAVIGRFPPARVVDVPSQFAAPMAVEAGARIMGLGFTHVREEVTAAYSALSTALNYHASESELQAAAEALRYLNKIVLQQQPVLDAYRQRGNPALENLSDEELASQFVLILFGGIETVIAAIVSTLHVILSDPTLHQRVMSGEVSIDDVVEESRRTVPPVGFVERWTREEIRLGDVTVPPNEFLIISLLAANRDPEAFAEPDRFMPGRADAAGAINFSHGHHACLGMHFARLETRVAVRRFLDWLPEGSVVTTTPPTGFAFRHVEQLLVAPAVTHD
jgi:cytochrome P450